VYEALDSGSLGGQHGSSAASAFKETCARRFPMAAAFRPPQEDAVEVKVSSQNGGQNEESES